MNYWYFFWIMCFTLAGITFAVITLIVLIRGISDLRRMFARLESGTRPNDL